MKTLIIRHKRENLKKCSLQPLFGREGFEFLSYPLTTLPDLSRTVVLTLDAPQLSADDAPFDLLVLDATWRLAGKMERVLGLENHPLRRSLPSGYKTAYPRRQEDCPDPGAGLASIEALYVAHTLLNRETASLLDHYYWKREFLSRNERFLS